MRCVVLMLLCVLAIAAAEAPVFEITGRVLPGSEVRFKANSGKVYNLIKNDHATAIFTDTNLHSRILILKGREHPGDRFEVTGNLHALKNGRRHELFYYCSICAIETSIPGPCLCCREDVVLTERPAAPRP